MASNAENLMNLTLSQIQAMSKKDMGVLLYGIIQLNAVTIKTLSGVSQQLDVIEETKVSVSSKIDDIKDGTGNIIGNIKSLTDRINELEATKNQIADSDLQEKFEELDQRLSASIKDINRAQMYQQRFIEEMDAKSRRNNLIILGVPEESVSSPLGLLECDRVIHVLQKTDVNVSRDNLTIWRIGSNRTQSTPRPLLITLDSHETCKEILRNAKNLKDTSDCTSIFIRRDTHPTLRYEANRLRIREREEKADPRNRNADIQYDRNARVLLKNGEVIDRFFPSFL